jgi:hypothetical protein
MLFEYDLGGAGGGGIVEPTGLRCGTATELARIRVLGPSNGGRGKTDTVGDIGENAPPLCRRSDVSKLAMVGD